ncbi:MAG: SPOR domain-containing protein [Paracoccaceae bacterium]
MRDDSYLDSGTATAAIVRKWRSGAATVVGALISLTILTGVVVWSYRLGVRDADDIPVIRADSGLTKMRPEEAGGQTAPHQGREVFDAVTGAEKGDAESAALAPPPARLAAEDLSPAALSPAPPARPGTEPPAETGGLAAASETAPEPISLSEEGAPATEEGPPEDLLAAAVAAAVAQVVGGEEETSDMTEQAPRYSPAAAPRPARTVAATPAAAAAEPRAEAAASPIQIQLGAFDSKAIAEDQWAEIKSRNSDFLSGRASVISAVQSGGRTLWRLRAGPFESVSEAAALCRGLEARSQACIVARAR